VTGDPAKGDPPRNHGPGKDGVPLWWTSLGRNKRTITLNVGQHDGAAVVDRGLDRPFDAGMSGSLANDAEHGCRFQCPALFPGPEHRIVVASSRQHNGSLDLTRLL